MARHKSFDRDIALNAAIGVFAQHGYEGSSTEDLLCAMGISRQSLYDTFGDKRRLYLEALQTYNAQSVFDFVQALDSGATPLKGLRAALLEFVCRASADSTPACLGVSAICEFGRSDQEVNLVTDAIGRTLRLALERRLADAKAVGEIGADVDVPTAVQFIGATLAGLKVSARGGAAPQVLSDIARMALRSLT